MAIMSRNGTLLRSSSDRLSRHCYTGCAWVLLVILESGDQKYSPDLESELAINKVATQFNFRDCKLCRPDHRVSSAMNVVK